MFLSPHASRGQVMPVWILAIIVNLVLIMFIANQTNVLRWQIRAQNAADAGAGAALAVAGDANNQIITQLYALQIDEYRIRYLNQALIDLIDSNSTDETTYEALNAALKQSIANYDAVLQDMQVALDLTNGGEQLAQTDGWIAFASGGCPPRDCAFTYTALDVGTHEGVGTSETADVATCRIIPSIFPTILRLPGNQFRAVGRASVALVQIPSTFSPGDVNPATAVKYQPDETYGVFTLTFSGLTVSTGTYTTVPTAPYESFVPSTVACA
jgi:hypothetical protein